MEEVELLKAIYGDEAVELRASQLLVTLTPRVGCGVALVSATMAVALPVDYPRRSPDVAVERSRGLSDRGLSALHTAALTALEAYEGEECLCQVMAEVNEALDLINDESECLICLETCGSASVTRAACGHIFHAACLGYWAALQKAEAMESLTESTSSVRSQRDALSREALELESQLLELQDEAVDLEALIIQLSERGEVEEDGPTIEEQLAVAKEELKSNGSRKRRAEAKRIDLTSRLRRLDGELSASTRHLDAAGLPCPVCRVLIPSTLLPKQADSPPTDASGEVESLPEPLRKQVRELQKQHRAILQEREERLRKRKEEELKAQVEEMVPEPERPAEQWRHEDRYWSDGYKGKGRSKGKRNRWDRR